jgi:hypothetical protein
MRVTVRGRFSDLGEYASEYLRSNQDQHDVSRAEYTLDGTLTDDSLIDFFSMRYIRLGEDDPDELAATRAVRDAGPFRARDVRRYVMATSSSSPLDILSPSALPAK